MGQQSSEWSNVPKSKLGNHLMNERNLSNDNLRFLCAWFLTRLILAPALFFYTRIINRTRFYGLKNLKKVQNKSYMVCTNHTSSFDIWMGFEIGFASLKNYFSNQYYLCGLGAVDRLGPWLIRKFCINAGVLPVDRSQGLEQYALQDIVRLLRQEKRKIACLIYPEGTRSKNGFLSREYKARAGWVQSMTGVQVLPVYQVGYDQLPGVGKTLEIHIGEPMEFSEYQGQKESPATWIKVTDLIMEKLFQSEQELHPRKAELAKYLRGLAENKNKQLASRHFIEKNIGSVAGIGSKKVCEQWRTNNAILIAGKNPHLETFEWVKSIHNKGSLALLTQWPNTDRQWIKALVDKLNNEGIPYGLRLCHHPLIASSEGTLISSIDKSLCRLVLLEGYIRPPDFVLNIDLPLAAVLVSHDQANIWSSTSCKFFILQGDAPGAKLHRSSSQMIELIGRRSINDKFWGATDVLTPFDAEDCLRRGADFLLLDGLCEWVSDNAWSESLRSELKNIKDSQIQLLPDPEYFDLGTQSACLVLDRERAFRIRKLGDCSGENVEKQFLELLEIEGLKIDDMIACLTRGRAVHFSHHFSQSKHSDWNRKDWQLILRAYFLESQLKPAYVKVDPTVPRLFHWLGDFKNDTLSVSSVIENFIQATQR